MAFDGVTTKNILIELNKNLINTRVEKIYVPTKNDVFINFHTQNRENLKLLISIDANNARLHFTNNSKENPVKAPQICMIFRKHLQGAKLISIKQHGLDRIIIFTFQNFNEMGDLVERKLIVELMGKYSNIILTNENNKIIDSMRHVDITMSSVREVLPNKEYIYPTTLGKINFNYISFEMFKENLLKQDDSIPIANRITNTFVGFGKSFVSSILEDLNIKNLTEENMIKIYDKLVFIFKTLENNPFNFLTNNDSKDYILDINNLCNENLKLSKFLDDFYSKKESISLIKVAKLNIEHDVKNHLSKLNKKLKIVNETLKESEDYEKYRIYGELLNCNMHLIKLGMDKISVINFYDNNNMIDIPLQVNLTPSRNAQNYFKKYNKAKSAIMHATKYKKEYEDDISYLNSVLSELSLAESLNEIDEIREELVSEGYIKKMHKKNLKRKDAPSEPIKYEFNGVEILVGRNNIQNDRLTFKIAKKSYMWLHTKDIHGSHVIIKSDIVSDELLYEAAKLAVKHSQGKYSSKVSVDYTLVKYVHKEIGAKPGMVVYTDYHTIVV